MNIVLVLGLAFVFATQVNEEMLIGLRDLAANPQEGMEISQDVATAIDTMFRFPSIAGYLFTMIVVNVMLVISPPATDMTLALALGLMLNRLLQTSWSKS